MAISEEDKNEAKAKIARAIMAADDLGIPETEIRRVAEQAINALRGR